MSYGLTSTLPRSGDARPVVHVGATRRDDRWELHVRDEGIGIPPRRANDIFRIFQLHPQAIDRLLDAKVLRNLPKLGRPLFSLLAMSQQRVERTKPLVGSSTEQLSTRFRQIHHLSLLSTWKECVDSKNHRLRLMHHRSRREQTCP